MGSIRPLVTITILVIVGAYLYVKINKGPVQQHAGNSASNQSPDGVPPLSATKGASLSTDSAAPAWPAGAPSVTPPATSIPVATADANTTKSSAAPRLASNADKNSSPAVPPIPELPELPAVPGLT